MPSMSQSEFIEESADLGDQAIRQPESDNESLEEASQVSDSDSLAEASQSSGDELLTTQATSIHSKVCT